MERELGDLMFDVRIILNLLNKIMNVSLQSYTEKAFVKAAVNIRNQQNVRNYLKN